MKGTLYLHNILLSSYSWTITVLFARALYVKANTESTPTAYNLTVGSKASSQYRTAVTELV